MPLIPPHLGDKLADLQLLAAAGGQMLLQDKTVLEFGPSYGVELYYLAPVTSLYVVVESAPDVIDHVRPLIELLNERKRCATLLTHDLRKPLPMASATDAMGYDVVIDFGTVDNVLATPNSLPYEEAIRVLKPGGTLITSYANFDHFKTRASECGDEYRFSSGELMALFKVLRCDVVYRQGEDQPRAGMVVKKR
jgi:SAM-dependent methyltransferase